jgi:signal transduction histidine kinase/ABC-type amino acid transport substrate-binding protein
MNSPSILNDQGNSGKRAPSLLFGFLPVLLWLLAALWPGLAAGAATAPPPVLVGSELDFPPYAMVDKHGQPEGFSVDLIKAVADAMGLTIKISTGPWDKVWNDLVAGRIDMLPIVAKSPERQLLVDFSLPHTETYDAFFVRRGDRQIPDIDAARGKEIVVMRSDAAHHQLLARHFQGRLFLVDTIPPGLALISSGMHDAFLCSKLIGTMVIKEHGLKNLAAGPPIPDYKRVFSFAVKKGDAELLEKLNQGLLIIKTNREYNRIYEKWLAAEDPWRRWEKYLWLAINVVAAAALIVGVWVVLLQLLVKKRTRELAESNEMLRLAQEGLEEKVSRRTLELTQANVALKNKITECKQAEDALKRQHAILAGINRVFRESLTCENEERLGETCLDAAEELTGSKFGFLGELNPEGNLDDLAICYSGWEACKIPGTEELVLPKNLHGRGIYGVCLREGRSEIANDPATHPDRIGVPEGHPPLTSFLGVPLKHGGKAMGMIGLANKEGGYTLADQEAVEALSVAVVEAFRRHRAEKDLQKRTVQLEAANKELEAFSYSVSHDLKTPIRAIEGFSRMLAAEHARQLDEEGLRFLNVICNNTRLMAQLIDDLLALSRLGRQQVRKSPLNLGGLAQRLFQELRDQAPKRDIRLAMGDPPPAFADPNLLTMVLTNLLANAIKYTRTRETAVIEVGGRWEHQETVYYVKDNGVGFDDRYGDKLFGVFQRLHRGDEYEGTGVGLAIVKRIVDMHGGRVWAESKVDGGATFYFALPQDGK